MGERWKAADVPERPILEFLRSRADDPKKRGSLDVPATWWPPEAEPCVPYPEGVPPKVAHAKMKNLVRRGLVDGCLCGCRGDFQITAKGRGYLRDVEDQERRRPIPVINDSST